MARLIVLQGEQKAAETWAEVWKASHSEGMVYNEYEDSRQTLQEAWSYTEGMADTDEMVLCIVNSIDTIEVLEFAEEPDDQA